MIKKRIITQKGQGMTEFALTLPILLIFMFLIVDLSRVVYVYSAINNAAREGARFAIARPGSTQSEIAAESRRLTGGLPVTVTTVPLVLTDTTDVVEVSIDYIFTPATPVLRLLTGNTNLRLRSRASMQVEW
jgi:Flp pilus assembly protein TadG